MTASRAITTPVRPALDHRTAARLAAEEYRRVVELLEGLTPRDWLKPTECPGWDVRAMASHLLGMAHMAASLREQRRQVRLALARGGVMVDALTGLQVEERKEMTPADVVRDFAVTAPRAARVRRWTPPFIRRRRLPQSQAVGGRDEWWTVGYLTDVILTRDPWMHRVDIARATGAPLVHTPEHDGVLVADIVAEWSARHGQPFHLTLDGPAGGQWSSGSGGPEYHLDTVEFCRILSGRATGDGLLTTEVPF